MKKHWTVIIFLIIIAAPLFLSVTYKITGIRLDTSLYGYSDEKSMPELSILDYYEGKLQKEFSQWFEQKMVLRGAFTKTYNSLRLCLFNLGNRPIGKDNYIYDESYIYTELAIDDYDLKVKENNDELQKLVDDLSTLNEKLKSFGKYLYVYITPSKAEFTKSKIPDKYYLFENGGLNVVDCFRSKMELTDVPYYICSDMANDLEYPAFYSTGIHWSRTYEQKVTQKIIADMSTIANKNYRNLIFDGVESSYIPYKRDRDVYDLLNVWFNPDITYYQYNVTTQEYENNDELNVILMGDSFGLGLKEDVMENLPEDHITYIDRDNIVTESKGQTYQIYKNFDNIKLQKYLDLSDFVAIEIVEPELICNTYGFVEYLNNFLDSYSPCEKEVYYPSVFDASDLQLWDNCTSRGVYWKEEDCGWIEADCKIILNDSDFTSNKLEIEYCVPNPLLYYSDNDEITVTISINNKEMVNKKYTESTKDKIIIDLDEVTKEDFLTIDIKCSDYFNPFEKGENDDNRNLALQLMYLGGER